MTTLSPYREPTARLDDLSPPSLGRLRGTHRAPPAWRKLVVPGVLFGTLILVSFAVSAGSTRDPWIGVVACTFVGLTFALFFLRANRCVQVLLYEEGLVIARRRRSDVVMFEDVDELWLELQFVEMPGVGGYARIIGARVVRHDGSKCDVPLDVHDGVHLAHVLNRRCSSHLLPDARAALRAGETLHFGKARLDKDGLTLRGSRFRWDDLRFARLESGRITLVPRNFFRRSRALSLDDFPHPFVLLALVREFCPRIKVEKALVGEA